MRIRSAVCTTLLLSCLGCPADDPDPDEGEGADSGETTGAPADSDDAGDSTTGSQGATDSSGGGSDTTGSGGASSGSTGDDARAGECDPGLTPTLFVSFDGVTLTGGPDDAPNDTTQIGQLAEALAPYDGPLDLDEVMAIVAGHFAPFDFCVTRVRPRRGPYAMVVVTADNPFGPDVFGIAPLDCDDTNELNIAFVFTNDGWAVSTRALANVISSEFSVTIGLDTQTEDDADVMCRSCDNDVDRSFTDECLPVAFPQMCSEHEEHCPPGQQNSFQAMLTQYGPAR